MKRILFPLLALLTLSGCAPVTSTLLGAAPGVAASLGAPHLTVPALTVTVYNPTQQALGPAVVTVEAQDVKPGEGTCCTPEPEAVPLPRWNCSASVGAGGTRDLAFITSGPAPKLTRVFGTGYLGGSAVPVPLALVQ